MRDLSQKPSLEGTAAAKGLGELFAEYDKWYAAGRSLGRELQAAEGRKRDVANLDIAAAATSARAGEPDPGPVETKRLEALIEKLKNDRAVAIEVRSRIERDVEKALRQHGASWGQEASERAHARREELQAALSKFEAIARDVARLELAAAWLGSEGQVKTNATIFVKFGDRRMALNELLEMMAGFAARSTVPTKADTREPEGATP